MDLLRTRLGKKVHRKCDGKTVHLNSVKEYHERESSIHRLTILAESDTNEESVEDIGEKKKLIGEGTCDGFCGKQLRKVLDKYESVLNVQPGLTQLGEMRIDTGSSPPISQLPYRPPERLLAGIKEELDCLLKDGIIVPLSSCWSSPIIPVGNQMAKSEFL